MPRKLNDFITSYLEYTKNSEPAKSYHLWSCFSILAAALERKVYHKWGRQTLYPNLYIILVGPSGRARKGTTISFARTIMSGININLIEGAITEQALIRRMAGCITTYTEKETNRIKFQCPVTFLSEELSVFLGQKNISLLATLCNWFDCPDQWKYDTKNMGTDHITGVYFNMLAGTAPEWLQSMLPMEAVGGGFTSRVIWVVEEDKRATVVNPTYDEQLEADLIHDLEIIHLLEGEAVFTEEAQKRYAEWYTKEDYNISRGHPPIADPKFAGYCERRATLLKKLAILVSVSEGNSLVVEASHFDRALAYLLSVEKKMARAFTTLGQSRYVNAIEMILAFVIKRKIVTRSQILRLMWRDVDDYTYDIAIKTLLRMKVISVEYNQDASEQIIKLIENPH